MTSAEVQVPQEQAVQHIDWQFLAHLKALERAIDLSALDGDIMTRLRIDEKQINKELEEQPARSFMYAAIAIRMAKILALYEATLLKQYQAHVHGYATLFLKATGGKDTIDGKKEAAITLFGTSVTSVQKLAHTELCLRGEKLNLMTVTKLDKYIEEDIGRWGNEVEMMMSRVYPDGLQTYEDMVNQHEELKEKKELASSLADTFRQRGIAVTSIASNLRSGGAGDGLYLRGRRAFDPHLIQMFKKAWSNNPNAPDEMLADIFNSYLS